MNKRRIRSTICCFSSFRLFLKNQLNFLALLLTKHLLIHDLGRAASLWVDLLIIDPLNAETRFRSYANRLAKSVSFDIFLIRIFEPIRRGYGLGHRQDKSLFYKGRLSSIINIFLRILIVQSARCIN
jgi:hypothetical protein